MWLCGSRTRSPDYPEFGLFTFLFCKEWQRNVPRFITYMHSNCIAKLRLRLQEHAYGLKSTRLYPFKTISKSIRFPSLYTKTICPPFWLLRRARDMFCYQRLRDDYTLKYRKFVSDVAKRKDVSNFVWTDEEVKLLLRITNE